MTNTTYPYQIDLVKTEIRYYLHRLLLGEELYLRGIHSCTFGSIIYKHMTLRVWAADFSRAEGSSEDYVRRAGGRVINRKYAAASSTGSTRPRHQQEVLPRVTVSDPLCFKTTPVCLTVLHRTYCIRNCSLDKVYWLLTLCLFIFCLNRKEEMGHVTNSTNYRCAPLDGNIQQVFRTWGHQYRTCLFLVYLYLSRLFRNILFSSIRLDKHIWHNHVLCSY